MNINPNFPVQKATEILDMVLVLYPYRTCTLFLANCCRLAKDHHRQFTVNLLSLSIIT